MDLTLPAPVEQLRQELASWSRSRTDNGVPAQFTPRAWQGFLRWRLLEDLRGPESMLAAAAAYLEVAAGGLPGPVLEADLAVATGSADARAAIEAGRVVTSVVPSARPTAVGWGAVADLTVDQLSGRTLASAALPRMTLSYPHPHGWLEVASQAGQDRTRDHDQLRVRRWALGAAVLAGLGQGALELTRRYVVERRQFGRPISSFQAVQFPLAECRTFVEGMRLSAYDAAWRVATERPNADVAAALAWISAARLAHFVSDRCHQAFGAFGLCIEAGLVELTWAIRWLRQSIDTRSAREFVADRRDVRSAVPPSLVLRGFGGRG